MYDYVLNTIKGSIVKLLIRNDENAKGPEIDKLTKTGLKFRHCFQISLSIFMTIFNQVQIQ